MVIESLGGAIMRHSFVGLYDLGGLPPREHGKRLVVRGLVSLAAWILVVLCLMLVTSILDRSEPMPDIGSAIEGPPAERVEGKGSGLGFVTRVAIYAFVIVLIAFIFWGGFSSLMIASGMFERITNTPVGEINTWFSQLVWYAKIGVFPLLLVAVTLVIGMPLLLIVAIEAGVGSSPGSEVIPRDVRRGRGFEVSLPNGGDRSGSFGDGTGFERSAIKGP